MTLRKYVYQYRGPDLSGTTFHYRTVLRRLPKEVGKAVHWLCRCVCGKEWPVAAGNLSDTKSCGCKRGVGQSPTSEQVERMLAAYNAGQSFVKAAGSEGFGSTTLRNICRERGIRSRPPGQARGFSRAQEPRNVAARERRTRVVVRLKAGETSRAIADEFRITRASVSRIRKEAGITTDYFKSVNHEFFATMDTERQAYWLGFLTADGNVDDIGTIRLRLQRGDRDHVLLFREHVASTHAVQDGTHRHGFKAMRGKVTEYTNFTVHSPRMAADLAKCGVGPRKSLTATAWEGPAELMRHYWRGMIDGDGWLCLPTPKTPHLTLGFIGSRGCAESFVKWGREVGGSQASGVQKGKVWSVQFYSRAAERIIRELYRDSTVSLVRKAARAAHVIANPLPPSKLFDWSQLTREQLIEARNRLGNWGAVAAEIGVEVQKLVHAKTRLFAIYEEPKHNYASPADFPPAELLAAHSRLGSWRAVATEFNLSPITFFRWRKQNHLKAFRQLTIPGTA